MNFPNRVYARHMTFISDPFEIALATRNGDLVKDRQSGGIGRTS
jgi:hypothetical protein